MPASSRAFTITKGTHNDPSGQASGYLPPIASPSRTAARRAFSLTLSITQRDVVPLAGPDADRKPCAVWLA
jgi:hypothetical protein